MRGQSLFLLFCGPLQHLQNQRLGRSLSSRARARATARATARARARAMASPSRMKSSLN